MGCLESKIYTACWGFPCSSVGKESVCNAGNLGSIPGLGRFPGEGNGYQLQYSGLENFMDWSLFGEETNLSCTSNYLHSITLY